MGATMRRLFNFIANFVRLVLNNTTTNLYVATTGSDSNPGTQALPFLTVQGAIDYAAAGLFPGAVNINLAAGTYNGSFVAKSLMGKNAYVPVGVTTAPSSSSVVNIIGDNTTPGNVVLNGVGTLPGIFNMEDIDALYTISGVTFTHASANRVACHVTGAQSQVVLNNIAGSSITGLLSVHFGARGFYSNGAAGGTFAMGAGNFFFAGNGGYIRTDRAFTITGTMNALASGNRFGYIHFNTIGQTYNISNTTPGPASLFSSTSVTITGFGAGDIINISNRSAPLFLANGAAPGGNYLIQGAATFNLTDCTGGVVRIQQGCTFLENNANTWNYLGTSVATYTVYDAANICTLNGFTSAVPTFIKLSTAFRFGFDWRYTTPINARVAGALLTAGTGYFNGQSTQANYIGLYIARQGETIDSMSISSRVGNGAAHTDTYTVYKNGVATAMVANLTNVSSGTTSANPISLAAGDVVSFRVAVDAASAAVDVAVQLNIRTT